MKWTEETLGELFIMPKEQLIANLRAILEDKDTFLQISRDNNHIVLKTTLDDTPHMIEVKSFDKIVVNKEGIHYDPKHLLINRETLIHFV